MRAAIMTEVGAELTVDEVELEGPRAGEVLVDVRHCGVCHSDLHYLDGSLRTGMPVVLGHEAAGVVAEVGPGVTGLSAGRHGGAHDGAVVRALLLVRPRRAHAVPDVRGHWSAVPSPTAPPA